ncbi:hypothetical protein JB92DRAFT_3134480 [Gautieria morchelliformis]|nr:hypothetical protein JB92DRAFT_3134480 [Gautieria morchelliformis]
MATLWELVLQRLEYRSLTSKWGNASSASRRFGSYTVYDPNLPDALEDAVKNALHPIHVDPAFTSDLETLQRLYGSRPNQGVDLSLENMVQGFLGKYWLASAALILQRFVQVKGIGEIFEFAPADTTRHQQPDIRGQLTLVGVDVARVDISIIELKSEGIVTTYLVSYNMTWLCWTAASHLIVFRLVHHPPQNPYLVISDVVQVEDTREPDPDPVDKRIGERWMTCVVGCSLAGLAAHSRGQFHFDVEDLSSTSGDPKATPAEEEDLNALSDTTTSAGETSSGSNWTPQSGRQSGRYIDAFLVSSKGEVPCALAAPLVGSPLLTETEQYDQEGLPYRYRKTMDILCSTVPRLNVNGFLGRGSTGKVFSGSWQGKDVAVKLAEREESRDRLRLESVWYGKIAEREQAKDILPTFFGRFRHSFFDVLVE